MEASGIGMAERGEVMMCLSGVGDRYWSDMLYCSEVGIERNQSWLLIPFKFPADLELCVL